MKAIRIHEFGGVDRLKLEDDVIIPGYGDNEVLVRLFTAGVNPVDTYIRKGTYLRLPTLPYIPGYDGAGIVENIGDNVKNFKVGDRVFVALVSHGTYAQFTVATETNCFHLPDHLSFEQGAAIGIPYFTTYRTLFQKIHAKKHQHILVHGASGAVGLATCQMAKNAGLIVHGTAGSVAGEDVVKKHGLADFVQNHNDKDYLGKLLEQTPNKAGFDIIVEMLANVNLSHDLHMLAQNGVVIIVGSRGQTKIDPGYMMGKETSIVGVSLQTSTEEELKENVSAVLDGLNKHKLVPIVSRVYDGLEAAAQAHTDIIEKGGTTGKLVIKIDNN